MIGHTISHYNILEKLGGGGMGVVYKAHDTRLKRTVALKFLPPDLTRDPEAKERFIHEAQAASALDHPNICNIHEVAETADGQTFIVMGCYEGQTLKKKIEAGRLEINEVVDIAMQVAQGLQKAHEKEIVHRDIKPANIMITTDSVVKIVDFGLAKLSGRTLLTKSGSTLGTAAYMSPEQARGEQVDQRTDIWSLGVVLYEMLTGKRPFESEYEQALVYSILSQDPKPMKELRPDVPEAIERICRRTMAKDAKDRYQTTEGLISDLESFRAGSELSWNTRSILTKRRRTIYAIIAACVALSAMIGFLYLQGSTPVFDSVAVLPFENRLKDSTGGLFAMAIPEGITNGLHRVGSLKVPMFKSTQKFVGRTDYAAIAGDLGAKALVDGSVICSNNRVRVIVRLIDPANNQELWSESFDDASENVLDLQSNIAMAVVRRVRATMTTDEERRLTRSEKKVDPQAYELYLSARQDIQTFGNRIERGRWDSLIAKLQTALTIEPDNALYYSALAEGYANAMSHSLVLSSEVVPKMKAAVEKGMALDPDLAESQIAASRLDMYEYNMSRALDRAKHALESSPGSFGAQRSYVSALNRLGRFDDAMAIAQGWRELDPVAFRQSGWTVGQIYFFSRQYDAAITFYRDWLKSEPGSDMGHTMLALTYSIKNMHAEALSQNDSAPHWGVINRPMLLIRAGQRDLAVGEFRANYAKIDAYGKAEIYALLGQRDSAFYWFEESYKEPTGSMMWFPYDPFLDPIRDDPRYARILKAMNLPVSPNARKDK